MTSPAPCPQCGKPLPEDSAHEICPACLLGQGLATGTLGATASEAFPPLEEIAGKFPHFEILECLGRGGMGVVYKARQKSLNRLVAIKILAPERIHDGHFAARFSREAEILARLNHPHIVTIHDFGETHGLFYLVMEFVDGVNLREILRDGRMEPKQALAVVPEICDALQYAHDQGIVHRDIKPENILLDRLGRVKVADFGIAKLAGAESDGSSEESEDLTRLTEAGKVLGTPAYMAPEQVEEPAKVDHRADIYALGAVFYQMLTGETPKSATVPPSRKVAIDVRLDEIVLRALERDPDLRYQKVSDVRTSLDTLSRPPDPAKTGKAKWARLYAVAACVLLILAITLPSFFAMIRNKRDPSQIKAADSQRAWAAWEQQRFSEAKEAFEKSLQADPKNANDWNGLGWTLFNSGNPNEAIPVFEKAISIDPNQSGALNGLGQVALAQGNLQKAEEYLLRAAPVASAAWFGLARVYLLRGEYDKARPWAQKVVDTGQGGEIAEQMLKAAQEKDLSNWLRFKIKPLMQKSAQFGPEPQLRALAWLDEFEKGKRDNVWDRDGNPVTLSILDLPSSVEEPAGMNVSKTSAGGGHPRFLCAWISSPKFDNQSVADLTLLDSAGQSLEGYSHSEIAPATPENHNIGWLGITVYAGTQSNTPEVRTLKFRFSGGAWDARKELSPGAKNIEWLDTGVQVMPPAQNSDGKTTIQLIQDRASAREDIQWDFVAIAADGRTIESNGVSKTSRDNIQVERFAFNTPLSSVRTFEVRSRPIKTVIWERVPLKSNRETELPEPRLRAIALLDKADSDQAWTPDGKPILISDLHLPEHLPAPSRSDTGNLPDAPPPARSYGLWISDPSFDSQSVARFELADSSGEPIGIPNKIPATTGTEGWMTATLVFDSAPKTSGAITITLHYTGGPWTTRGGFARSFNGYRGVSDGVQIRPPAQDPEGHTVVEVVRDMTEDRADQDEQLNIVAITAGNEESHSYGLGKYTFGNLRIDRYQFAIPLSEVTKFEIRSRPVKKITWTDVPLPTDEEMILVVRADGTVTCSGQTWTFQQLEEKLQIAGRLNPQRAIVLQAAKDCPYTRVTAVFAACAKANLTKVAFSTQSAR